MADDFEYISPARPEYRKGYRHAYLGEVPETGPPSITARH